MCRVPGFTLLFPIIINLFDDKSLKSSKQTEILCSTKNEEIHDVSIFTRSERCNLVKYLYPVIYWRLFRFRIGVRVGDRSYNMHEITIVVSYWNC